MVVEEKFLEFLIVGFDAAWVVQLKLAYLRPPGGNVSVAKRIVVGDIKPERVMIARERAKVKISSLEKCSGVGSPNAVNVSIGCVTRIGSGSEFRAVLGN